MLWRLPPQCCSLTSLTHNHVVIINPTQPTIKHVLCMCKHYCRYTPRRINDVMLLSFARCGPIALAPSAPMLLPDIRHTHNDVVIIHAALPRCTLKH